MSKIREFVLQRDDEIEVGDIQHVSVTGLAPRGARFTVIEDEESPKQTYRLVLETTPPGNTLDVDVSEIEYFETRGNSNIVGLRKVEDSEEDDE